MKLHTALLLGALLTVPGIALAQDASPVPPPPPGPAHAWHRPDPAQMKAMMAKMRATMKQAQSLHKAERTAMLGALTAAHRTFLAWVVGQLAIATNPDPKAAAAQIDAKLTSSEKSAVLSIQKTYGAKMKALFAASFKAMPHPPAVNPGGPMKIEISQHQHAPGHHHPMTAGMALLAQTGFGRPADRMRMLFTRGLAPMGPGGQWRTHGQMGHGPGPVVVPPMAPVTPAPAPPGS